MIIVDAQVHIWAASTAERPWPPRHGPPHRALPYTKDELLLEMAAAGVDRVVIVPPSWEGERNDLALEAARLHPERFAVMGKLDISAPDAREKIRTWRQQPGMLGLRFTQAESAAANWVWEEAEAAGIPIMVNVPAPNLHLLEVTAIQHPGLKLIIDHLAIPKRTKDEDAFAHLESLLALAKRPNIAVKATGLATHTSGSYPFRELHPYIRRVYDAFGPRRIFWGTDRTKHLPCSYAQAVTMFSEEIPWLTAEDKEWIMGRAICEWTGWKLP